MDKGIEMICIGDELLDGRTREGNAAWLGGRLRALGHALERVTLVADEPALVAAVVREAAARSALVVTSGGLGPTLDDRTRAALADAAGVAVREDAAALERLEEKYRARGREMAPANARQAAFPANATVLPSDVGTADAFATPVAGVDVISLPGVPREFTALAERYVLPRLAAARPRRWRKLYTFGKGESALAGIVEALALDPRLRITWSAHLPIVDIELSCDHEDAGGLDEASFEAQVARAREALRPWAFETDTRRVNGALAAALAHANARVATVESCTGGLIARELTDVPGASAWFDRGWITYSNEAKAREVGVPVALLERHGAVSAEVAAAMATGARARAGVTLAVSSTGIAGPTGGSAAKPVGTVYLAAAMETGTVVVHAHIAGRSRDAFRTIVAELAQLIALRCLQGAADDLRALEGVVSLQRIPAATIVEQG